MLKGTSISLITAFGCDLNLPEPSHPGRVYVTWETRGCALKECPTRQATGELWHLGGAGKITGCGQQPTGLKMSGDSGRMVSMALST